MPCFPYRLIRPGGADFWTYDAGQLVHALVVLRCSTPRREERDWVLAAACAQLHSERMRALRAAGETVCPDCGVWVMEQFLECSCDCTLVPRRNRWVRDEHGLLVKRG